MVHSTVPKLRHKARDKLLDVIMVCVVSGAHRRADRPQQDAEINSAVLLCLRRGSEAARAAAIGENGRVFNVDCLLVEIRKTNGQLDGNKNAEYEGNRSQPGIEPSAKSVEIF